MAANLNETNGRVNFAHNARLAPWHKSGTAIPGMMTFSEAVVAGGLDYEVVKRPILALDADDALTALPSVPVPGHYATVRADTNKALGVVGSRYTVIQNRDAWRVFDPLLGEGNASFDTAGVIGAGERAFVLAALPSLATDFIGSEGDKISRFLLFVNSHDGSSLAKVLFTLVRVVCQNTLNAALQGASESVTIRHTAGADKQMAKAGEALEAEAGYWTKMREVLTAMRQKDVNRAKVRDFVEQLFPGKVAELDLAKAEALAIEQAEMQGIGADAALSELTGRPQEAVSSRTQNMRDRVVSLFDGEADGADLAGSTVYGLFNAATQYSERERSLRQGTDRWINSTFGSGADLRQKALTASLALLA